jgi:hypothetical protein
MIGTWPSASRLLGPVLVATLLLSAILVSGGGTYAPLSLVGVLAAFGLVAWVVIRVGPGLDPLPEPDPTWRPAPWAEPQGSWSTRHVPVIAWLMAFAFIGSAAAAVVFGSLGPISAPRVALGACVLLAALSVAVPLPRRTTWVLVTALGAVAMALAIASHTPSDNDVWYTVQGGADAILRGDNPYTECWPGNPDPKTDCVYAYLPATSISLVPFRVAFGDVRYGYILALAIASLAVFALASARAGIALGAILMVVGALLADRAWTEPVILAGIAGLTWGARQGRVLPVLGLALVLALKQHMVLVLPLAMVWPLLGLRWAILAAIVAAGSALPWFWADPVAFLDDTLWFHLGLVPRADSLSLYALLTASDIALPAVVGALVVAVGTGGAIMLAILRLPRDALGFVLGSAFVMFVFNLLNKQSFYNHHALVVGLLVLVLALETGRQSAMSRRRTCGASHR